MPDGKNIRKILLRLLGGVVSAALLALLAASLILAKPQEDHAESETATPSAVAGPAVTVDNENDLVRLVSGFPAPVMSFMGGSGMTFVSATSADAAVSGGFGRVATLNWLSPEGEQMVLRSIWPADALSLLEDGYHFVPYDGPTLFGSMSVRMENDASLRFHVSTGQALYVVTLSRPLSGQAGEICRQLQLFTANPQD